MKKWVSSFCVVLISIVFVMATKLMQFHFEKMDNESERIDSFNTINIDEIDVYINAGTAAGVSETIKKNSALMCRNPIKNNTSFSLMEYFI